MALSKCSLACWHAIRVRYHWNCRNEDSTFWSWKWGKLLNFQCFSNVLKSVTKVFFAGICCDVLEVLSLRWNPDIHSYLLGKWRGIRSIVFCPKYIIFPTAEFRQTNRLLKLFYFIFMIFILDFWIDKFWSLYVSADTPRPPGDVTWISVFQKIRKFGNLKMYNYLYFRSMWGGKNVFLC